MPVSLVLRFMRVTVVGFMYHVISDKQLPHVEHLYSFKSPDAFEADIRLIKQTYQLVSFEQLVSRLKGGYSWTKPIAFLSFDDGMSECFHHVRPILLRHRVPCFFFISTRFVDNNAAFYRHKVSLCIDRLLKMDSNAREHVLGVLRERANCTACDLEGFVRWSKELKWCEQKALDITCRTLGVDEKAFLRDVRPYMTLDELTQLSREGFTLGGHGTVHVQLGELQEAEQVEAEIVESCTFIREISKAKQVPFAFPFSGQGVNRQLLRDIMTRHPFISLIFDTRELAKDEPFIVNRIGADEPSQLGRHVGTAASVIRRACNRELELRFT